MEVKLHIISVIDKEQYELYVLGSMHQKGDFTYLQYEENIEGLGNVPTLVKIGKNELIIHRKGSLSMRQLFLTGKETTGIYQTPFGRLPFTIKTDRWEFQTDESQGTLTIEYQMMIEGSSEREHQVTIKIRKDGK